MRRAGKIVAAVFAVVVALAVAGVAILMSLDFNEYRTFVANKVEAATGRQLTIAGDLEVGVSLTPTIVIEDVTFANASWGTEPAMARLARLEAELEFWPLLTGDVRIKRLVLDGLQALIETNAEGRGNWVFGRAGRREGGRDLLVAEAEEFSVRNANIVYRSGVTGEEAVVAVDALDATVRGPGAPIRLDLRGRHDKVPFHLVGAVGSIEALIQGDTAFPLDFQAAALGAKLALEGTVADIGTLTGIDVAATLSGDDFVKGMAALRPWIPALSEFNPPLIGPYSAQAKLSGSAKELAASELSATAAGGDRIVATATGSIANAFAFQGADLVVTINAPEAAGVLEIIRPVAPALARTELPPLGPGSITGRLRGSAEALAVSNLSATVGSEARLLVTAKGAIGNAINFSDVDLVVSAAARETERLPQLVAPLVPALARTELPPLGPGSITGRLHGSAAALAISDLSATVGSEEGLLVTAKGAIENALAFSGVDLAVSARGQEAEPALQLLRPVVPALAGLDISSLGPVSVEARLRGSAAALAVSDLSATVGSGKTVLITAAGSIENALAFSGADLVVSAKGRQSEPLLRLARPLIPALAGVEIPPLGPVDIQARLRGSAAALAVSDLSATVGSEEGLRVTAQGAIENALAFSGADLVVSAKGRQSEPLLRLVRPLVPALAGVQIPPLGPVDIQARLRVSAAALAVSDLSATVGSGKTVLITAAGSIENALAFSGADLVVSAKGRQSEPLLRLARPLMPALAGVQIPPLGPVDIAARLRGSVKALSLSKLSMRVGSKEHLLVTAKGAIKDALDFGGLDIAFTAEGRDLRPLAQALGTTLPELLPLRVAGRLRDKGKTYVIDNLRAALGENDIAGDVTVTLAEPRPRVVANLDSAVIDLDALRPPKPEAKRAGAADRMFSNEPLPWDALRAMDVSLKVRIEQLRISGVALKDFAMDVRLDDGSLAIKPFRLSPQDVAGRFEGEIFIEGNASPPQVSGWLTATQLDAGRVLKVLEVSEIFDTSLDADLDIRASGKSPHALMASLDGRLQVIGRKGRIDSNHLQAAVTGIVDVLPWINSSEANNINCLVSRFDIANGRAASQAFLLDTNGMNVIGGGEIDLGKETLDLILVPKAKKLSLASLAMPVDIGGTLSDPRLSPAVGRFAVEKAKEVITRPLGTAFNIAKSPVEILGRLLGADATKQTSDACVRALVAARENETVAIAEASPPAAPSSPPSPGGDSLFGGIGSALRGILGGK